MKKLTLNLLLFVFVCISPLIGRDVTCFNDGWSFRKGPFINGTTLFSNPLDGKWEEVPIPHTWNAKDMQDAMVNMSSFRNPQQRFYTGEALYKKTYVPDVSLAMKRVYLRFEGVGSVATVYVNNKYAGKHMGAYSAFVVEIGSLLDFGKENEIVVLVDNRERPDVIPINNVLFGVYGGIYRDISLIVTEKINIAVDDYASPGIYVSQKNVDSKSANVNVRIKLDNKTKQKQEINLVTTIYEVDGKTIKEKLKNNNIIHVKADKGNGLVLINKNEYINKTRFKEHRKDFRYAEGKSKFSEHVLNEGHEMKTIEETISMIHLENNHRKTHLKRSKF